MIDLFKEYSDSIYGLICDVNEKEIGSQIADDNLKAWCTQWQCAAIRGFTKLITDAQSNKRRVKHEE